MCKKFQVNYIFRYLVILGMAANIQIADCQDVIKQQFTIPENINKIFETSCIQCHGAGGGRLPKSRLNFSRWASYGPSEEIKKAANICSIVTKGEMPPKSKRESNPELILDKRAGRISM